MPLTRPRLLALGLGGRGSAGIQTVWDQESSRPKICHVSSLQSGGNRRIRPSAVMLCPRVPHSPLTCLRGDPYIRRSELAVGVRTLLGARGAAGSASRAAAPAVRPDRPPSQAPQPRLPIIRIRRSPPLVRPILRRKGKLYENDSRQANARRPQSGGGSASGAVGPDGGAVAGAGSIRESRREVGLRRVVCVTRCRRQADTSCGSWVVPS